jgi:hypothetical protein
MTLTIYWNTLILFTNVRRHTRVIKAKGRVAAKSQFASVASTAPNLTWWIAMRTW